MLVRSEQPKPVGRLNNREMARSAVPPAVARRRPFTSGVSILRASLYNITACNAAVTVPRAAAECSVPPREPHPPDGPAKIVSTQSWSARWARGTCSMRSLAQWSTLSRDLKGRGSHVGGDGHALYDALFCSLSSRCFSSTIAMANSALRSSERDGLPSRISSDGRSPSGCRCKAAQNGNRSLALTREAWTNRVQEHDGAHPALTTARPN